MRNIKQFAPATWSCGLSGLANTLDRVRHELSKLPQNPFEAAKRMDDVERMFSEAGITAPECFERTKIQISNECTRASVGFWGTLGDACSMRGWDIVGTTDRRLIHKAVFVTTKGDAVMVEGASISATPYVPDVLALVSEQLAGVSSSEDSIHSFMVTMADVFDNLPKSGGIECSLESLYRSCVFHVQKSTFWKNPTASHFVSLSRPAFRRYLSELVRLGVTTRDGRRVVLGTTSTSKDAWEIYSPGEERVVIAGRIKLEAQNGH